MDGRIGPATNKHALHDNPLHSGFAAKLAKLDLLSEANNDAGICTEVRPKLKRSPSSQRMPDKKRTISSTDSSRQKATHAFDFRFVDSDDEVRRLLVAQTGDEHRDVTLISHPDDLSQANLVSRLSIAPDGRHTLGSGKLFEGSRPLTLVMDVRKLTSDELPKFNDLLDPDNPCLFDKVSQKKRPLGEHVSLLVLADPAQLASVGQSDKAHAVGAPGADFWRRINRPGNTWQFDAQTGDDPSLEIDKVPPLLTELPSAESVMDDDNTVLINCHLHNHWRHLLLGGPGVDKQGRIQHVPGKLESLRAGQRVILKGANWQDLAFEQTIRQMLAQKCFESNGEISPLPDDVQFYQMPVGKDELHSLFQGLSHSLSGNPIIINQSNIAQWLSPIAIAPEGYAVPNTCLLEQVRAGGAVTVTSPLNEAHWFHLLGSLQAIREATGLEPGLQVAHSKQQPKALGLEENDEYSLPEPQEKVRDHCAFNTVTYQQHAQASYWISHQPQAPLVIQINEQTGLSELFDNIHITSEKKAHFGRRQSDLQKALTAGKPVVFRGLETNPRLQQLLEPLVIGQPLLLNGQLQTYPQAQVTVLWPGLVKSPSSVFNSMVAKGKSCPEVDLWDLNADKHKISRSELPEQALDELYEAFKTVAHLCDPLPEITEGLLNNLILAARRVQQVDQSSQLLPCHWRKAINSVISHGTRKHPSARDFMKVVCWHLLPDITPDEDQPPSVDPDRLTAFINSAPQLDRAFVYENLWQLARAFNPAVFKAAGLIKGLKLSYENPLPYRDAKEILDRLCAIIAAHVPEEQRDALAFQLQVDPAAAKPWQSLAIRPTGQIKRLQDALASGWHLPLSPGQTRSDAIQTLATDCFHRARTGNSEAERIERIESRLSESLKWQGSADKPLSALAKDLCHGEIGQKDRESRRLSRLHDRLTDSPVIFLQGETGTGKSYFSAKMAKASGQASVLSLGPSDSEQTLMKRWQWQQYADGDRSMTQQNRTLMEWANIKSDKDGDCVGKDYITLVLDEANLAKTGLLASLNGLWEPQPCIYVNGHPVEVSPKHRVILTGNPDHYAGRQLDPVLKEKLPRAYYPRLDQAFLRDRVVEPALTYQLQRHLSEPEINDIARITAESVMALWQYYQELLPDHEFTPRDLTDICSWVGWYLDRALPAGENITCKQVNGLIQQSFRDLLGPEINETHQDAQQALEIWFAAHYEVDNTLRDKVHNHTLPYIQRAFETFTKAIRPEFDTSGSAVSQLVQQLGQDFSRCQQAYHLDRKHGGRQATLIEGPVGRGKDATLNMLIKSVKQQAEQRQESMPKVYLLNACDCSWDKVCEVIRKAKVEGGIVVISEMNLIDSQHLEGELNDILAGDAHPGFHLFATINPPEYSGRKPLSPALKGRFRHLPIRQYNPTELQTIAEKVLPESSEGTFVAYMLTEKHCRLRAYLQRKKLPLQPTSLDLQNVARAITSGGDFSEKAVHQCLNRHYRLYLMAANITLEKLPKSSALAMGKSEFNSGLCRWFHETVSGIDRPWLVRSSHLNSVDETKHEIRVNTQLDEKEARTELIKSLAQAKWQSSGLPLKPNESEDILTGTLYRRWQQRWFSNHFGRTNVDADSVFPLTEEQQQTLKMSANQPYLQAADQLIRAWKADEVQWWPALWHQISDLPNHLVDDFINEAPAIGGDKAPEQDKPQVHEKQVPVLDQRKNHESQPVDQTLTVHADKAPEKYIVEAYEEQAETLERSTNYDNQEKPHLEKQIVFRTENPSSRMDRWRVWDIYVSAQGDVKWINTDDQHMQGVEVLIPDRLPQHDQEVTLARNQTLATIKMTSNNGQYTLPSLAPDDCIVALRTKPHSSLTLVRDCYTGFHTVFIPNSGANQSIEFTYVVESRETGKKTPAEEVRTAQSTRFDVRCSDAMKTVLKGVLDNIEQQPTAVQVPLQRIKNAKSTTQRIEAIKDYCREFSCDALPEHNKNFFHFLVTQRQGSCLHRTSVFVAFCRYFGIPCRQITSRTHAFAECSPDRGQTWASADFGGAPCESTEIMPQFQPVRRVHCSGNESRQTREFLKSVLTDADLAEQQILVEAFGMSLEELNKAFETGSALPKKIPGTFEIVKHLWEAKDLTRFSLGVSMLQSLETEAFGEDEKALVGKVVENGDQYKPMAEALKKILSSSDEDQVSEQLKSLHSKMIDQVGTPPVQWLGSIVDVLANSDLTRPAIIHFAREALESGWLDPVLTYKSDVIKASEHHELLVRLESVDELSINAAHCLKKWYGALMSRGKNNQQWQQQYESFQKRKEKTLFVTHHHDGHSSFLKNKIASPCVEIAWTDKPEGVPDIERILLQHPAFMQSNSGTGNHRPVIILGETSPMNKVINEKAEALFQRKLDNSPDFKQIFEKVNQYEAMIKRYRDAIKATDSKKEKLDIMSKLQSLLKSNVVKPREQHLLPRYKGKCEKAIQQAFIHYLYGMTHSNGGSLTYCWAYPCTWRENNGSFGALDPSSPRELYAMMSSIGNSDWSQDAIKDDYLRHTLNASDALILKTSELTKIAEEFVNSVNLNSLYDLLDTTLESDYDGFFRLW
ncbi:AAA family ATPase [Endozoicomonas sp. 8E]|uniref:AAA family ATPase n=1 Tax=Endozoicomonas sp. 8E TaxID=3035692 RepID=UPI00293926F7|nr:AAA family ATPase [Endozoicomonas sp. 8E]WOG28882.1 AAA family ATPase [Endozoicomonas sp. 8E]